MATFTGRFDSHLINLAIPGRPAGWAVNANKAQRIARHFPTYIAKPHLAQGWVLFWSIQLSCLSGKWIPSRWFSCRKVWNDWSAEMPEKGSLNNLTGCSFGTSVSLLVPSSSLVAPERLEAPKLDSSRARKRLRTTRFPMTTVARKKGTQTLLATNMQSHMDSIHSPHSTRNTIMKLCMKSMKFQRGISWWGNRSTLSETQEFIQETQLCQWMWGSQTPGSCLPRLRAEGKSLTSRACLKETNYKKLQTN